MVEKTVLQLSADELQRIRNAVHDKQIFLVEDDSILCDIQCVNIVVGSLETLLVKTLLDSPPLPCAPNSNSIAQGVDAGVTFLAINRNSFCLLLSDGAKYMMATGTILKSLYPNLFQVTCVAHLLHNRSIKIKSHRK